jgi:hypothetical protein
VKKFVIAFAGVPDSSKTTIINHLSPTFGLPVFGNDQLRYEVKEDLMVNDINVPQALEQYNTRVEKERLKILEFGKSIIFDCSVDRRWAEYKELLSKTGYSWFLISLDFSKEFMAKLYTATGLNWAAEELDAYHKQHQDFLAKFADDASLHLTDKDFQNRVQICVDAVSQFIAEK